MECLSLFQNNTPILLLLYFLVLDIFTNQTPLHHCKCTRRYAPSHTYPASSQNTKSRILFTCWGYVNTIPNKARSCSTVAFAFVFPSNNNIVLFTFSWFSVHHQFSTHFPVQVYIPALDDKAHLSCSFIFLSNVLPSSISCEPDASCRVGISLHHQISKSLHSSSGLDTWFHDMSISFSWLISSFGEAYVLVALERSGRGQ